jgi:hypothetical protein
MNASTNIAGALSPTASTTQCGGQAVGGCHGRQSDHDVSDETEGAGLQALTADRDSRRFLYCHERQYTVVGGLPYLVLSTSCERGN